MTIGAPLGEENRVHPVEAAVFMNESHRRFVMLIQCEPQDIIDLQKNGGIFWLHMLGAQLQPFNVGVVELPMWPCPHCNSENVDRGFTGLDACNDCDGLSRWGKPLEREV